MCVIYFVKIRKLRQFILYEW